MAPPLFAAPGACRDAWDGILARQFDHRTMVSQLEALYRQVLTERSN